MFNKQSDNDKIKLNEIKYFLEEIYKSSKKEDEIYFYFNKKFKNIQFFMPSLEIISQVSPLIGLLGTVIGMIETFQAITVFGTGDPKQMAGGISQALVTTMLGLIFAAPLLAMYTLLSEIVSGILQEFEEFVAVNIVKKIQ